jgi:hypothetical protein
MDELVKTLGQYVEFLILGALALGLLVVSANALAGRRRNDARKLALPDLVGKDHPNVRLAVQAGVVFAVLFLAGFAINALGYWFLQPAHVHVIHYTAGNLAQESAPAGFVDPDAAFFARPLARRLREEQLRTYQEDAVRQMDWQMRHSESFNAETASLLKYVRLLRGLVLLAFLFAVVSIVVFFWNIGGGPEKSAARTRWLGYFAGAVLFYLLSMGMYWQFESNFHHGVWVTQFTLPE